jgi:hypothetical protein
MKYYLSLFLILSFKSFSQIDTSIIFKEIRELKTDEMIEKYWENLKECDQNIHTFNNPVLQTENLLKVVYFFKYFGFSKYCYFDKSKEHSSNFFEDAQIIWIHQTFTEMNLYTFPLISECGKLKINDFSGYDPYFMQGVLISRSGEKFDKIAYEKLKYNKFNNINIDSLSSLALEFMKVYREINAFPIEQGIWKFKENNKLILYKTKKGDYYLNVGNYFKLKKINENTFQFNQNIDDTYFEIDKNGNLINKDENGKMLNMYEKVLLKY